MFNEFDPPAIDRGRVWVPEYARAVRLYGRAQ